MGEMADFERDHGNGREGTGGVDKKLYTMPTLKRVGKKDWKCTLCSKDILKGVEHHYWRSPADGYTENRVHLKCFEKIMERGVHEYRTRTKKTPPLPDNSQDELDRLNSARFLREAADALQALERVPMTEEVALKIAHRRATTYTHRSDPHYSGYAFVPHTLMDFVHDLETHHNITPPESKG